MSTEWADDTPRMVEVRVKCLDSELHHCQWRGEVVTIESYGTVDYDIEECPECGGEIECME